MILNLVERAQFGNPLNPDTIFTPNMNTASRLLELAKILSQAISSNPSSYSRSKAFLEGRRPESEDMIYLSGKIDLVSKQIDLLEQEIALDSRDIPEEIYDRHIQRMRRSLAPHQLGNPWKDVNKGFNGETIVFLEWYAFISENQELAISEQDLEQLKEATQNFYNELQEMSASNPLKITLIEQTKALIVAISNYPVNGIGPIGSALNQATGQLYTRQEFFKDSLKKEPEESGSIFRSYVALMSKVSTITSKADKFAQAGNNFITFGQNLLGLIPESGA